MSADRKADLELGSGPAGAATAYYLRQLEAKPFIYNVTIFEGENRLGGRIKTIEVPYCDSQHLDVGASHYFASDDSTSDLMSCLGLQEHQVPVANSQVSANWNGKRIVETTPDYLNSWRAWMLMTLRFGVNFVRGLRIAQSISTILREIHTAIPFEVVYSIYRLLVLKGAAGGRLCII